MDNHRSGRNRIGYILLVLVGVCAIAPLPLSKIEQYHEEQHIKHLQQVVQLIQDGALKPNQFGDIILPSRLASLTKNGHVYLSRDPKQPFILFPEQIENIEVEWQTGLPLNQRRPTEHKLQIEGYVYSRLPFRDGWSVDVDDPAVEPIYAVLPPVKLNWYYAVPDPD